MIDDVNPTSQFHPYQPQDAVPVAERPKPGAFDGILNGLGIDRTRFAGLGTSLKNMDLGKARNFARGNGGLILGGLAALAIGAGLLRRRH